MTKAINQRYHAKCRAEERYGLKLNMGSYSDICNLITMGKSQPIERQSNRISVHLVNYRGKKLKAVYDKNRHNIVTFLPMEESL